MLTRPITLLSACVACAAVALAQPAVPASGAAVLALEDTLNAAWLRHDTRAVGRLIAADFRGITERGRAIARADMLRAVARTDEIGTEMADRTARAFGDVVVTTARITDRRRRTTGEAFTVFTVVTDVWVRRAAGWQLVAAHESLAPP